MWACHYSSKADCPYSFFKDDDGIACVPMIDALPLFLGMQYPHLHFMLVGKLICLPFVVLQWYFSVLVLLGLSAPIEFPCVGLVFSDMCRAGHKIFKHYSTIQLSSKT